ncbi:MAG: site-specific integrase, partial [Bacteroidales bacterium]|nr:site-specific integrase [Bacteroidales bacterium]
YTAGNVWITLASLSENPGAEEFRSEFERLRPRFSGGFFDVMILFMEEGSQRWSSGTYRKVRSFYNQLREFEKEEAYPLQFNTIQSDFFDRFVSHQQNKGRSAITVRKMVNMLVWYLNWATDHGYNVYSDYRSFYKLLEKDAAPQRKSSVHLEWNELIKFMNYNTGTPRKERVRDLFCLICFTGLRFEELKRLRKEDVGTSVLQVRKGNGNVRQIPLNSQAVSILEKYKHRYYRGNAALPPASVVTVNKYIRIIAKELKLYRQVPHLSDQNRTVPLWEVLTAGAGVQTFIMHALRLEIPPEVIATFTGVTNDQRVKLLAQEMATKQIKKFNEIPSVKE